MDASNRWYWLLQYRESCRSDTTDSRQKKAGEIWTKKKLVYIYTVLHMPGILFLHSLSLSVTQLSLWMHCHLSHYIYTYMGTWVWLGDGRRWMAGVSALHICVFQCWIAVLEAAVLFVIIVTDGKEQEARRWCISYADSITITITTTKNARL